MESRFPAGKEREWTQQLESPANGVASMGGKTIRVITRGADGEIRTRDFDSFERLDQSHEQVGIDDCNTDLSLRGLPLYRGLIGPISDGKSVARYESPDVFEQITKEWSAVQNKRRRRPRCEVDNKNPAPSAIG
jgi:hypothetical protein